MKLGGNETDPKKRALRVYKEASVVHMFANTPEGGTPSDAVVDESMLVGFEAAMLEMKHLDVPIPMVLHCPACGAQHIDAAKACGYTECAHAGMCYCAAHGQPELCERWDNPPHRSHLCHSCGCIWRAADVCTTGVANILTIGSADTWPLLRDAGERDGE